MVLPSIINHLVLLKKKYVQHCLGFAAIFTRLSDSMGRQEVTVAAWVIFGAFSLGGGLAKTLNQLIVCRVIQGVGGSGLYSMIMVVGPEITPPKYWGAFSGIIGMTIATGSILGTLLCEHNLCPVADVLRAHFGGCDNNAHDLEVDLLVQCSMCHHCGTLLTHMLAWTSKKVSVTCVIETNRLLRCHTTFGRIHAAYLRSPRGWSRHIPME